MLPRPKNRSLATGLQDSSNRLQKLARSISTQIRLSPIRFVNLLVQQSRNSHHCHSQSLRTSQSRPTWTVLSICVSKLQSSRRSIEDPTLQRLRGCIPPMERRKHVQTHVRRVNRQREPNPCCKVPTPQAAYFTSSHRLSSWSQARSTTWSHS